MTRPDHRSSSLTPARGTAASFDAAPLREMAFLDARRHMATSRNVSFGKRVQPPTTANACAANCGHPACRQGCTLIGRFL
jgi:hypothetical protein